MPTPSNASATRHPPAVLDLPLRADMDGVETNAEWTPSPGAGAGGSDGMSLHMPEGTDSVRISFCLSTLNINPRDYDEIHIHARHQGGEILFSPRLTAYPVPGLKRSWYSKAALPRETGYVWRVDLHVDDDGWQRPDGTGLDRNTPALHLDIFKKWRRTPGELPWRKVWIENVRLVRRAVSVDFNELEAVLADDGHRIEWRYALRVQNRRTEPMRARVRLDTTGLQHFAPDWTERTLDLAPREEAVLPLVLSLPREHVGALAPLHGERVQVFAGPADSSAPESTPLLGYRPRHVWAVVPPPGDTKPPSARDPSDRDPAGPADRAMRQPWGVPLHGPEIHPQGYQHPETGRTPEPLSWFRHRDPGTGEIHAMERGAQCRLGDRIQDARVEDFLGERYVLAHVGQAHMDNFRRAELLADAWRETGDLRYAEAARDVFLEYARLYSSLPVQWAESTSGASRIGYSTLMTAFRFEDIARAYAKIRTSPALGDADRRAIEEEFFLPEMLALYRHNVGHSNMQIHHFQAYTAGVFALQRGWNLLGDALHGDHGFHASIEHSFTGDGLAHEAGVYHWFLLRPFVAFAEMMERHGVPVADARLKRVFDFMAHSSPAGVYEDRQAWPTFAFAYRAYRDPAYVPALQAAGRWPLDGLAADAQARDEEAAGRFLEDLSRRNTHFPDSGYLWLRTRSARGPRALSINYIMQWDRLEFDRLHFSLFAPHRATHEVGRISYGSQFAGMMYDTLGHQAVVVNRQNQAPNPSILAAFLDRGELPAALIVGNPASPLYPGFDSARVVALLDDIFFVGDLYHAREGGAHVFDWPFYVPWEPGEPDPRSGVPRLPLPLAPLDEPLGRATDPGYRFLSGAEGVRSGAAMTVVFDVARKHGRPATRTHVHFAPMEDALFVRARVPRGPRPEPGPVLLVRQDGRSTAAWGAAIDVAEPGHESAIRAVRRMEPTLEGVPLPLHRAVAWEIETRTGRYAIIVNRTGKRVRAGGLDTDRPLAVERMEPPAP